MTERRQKGDRRETCLDDKCMLQRGRERLAFGRPDGPGEVQDESRRKGGEETRLSEAAEEYGVRAVSDERLKL